MVEKCSANARSTVVAVGLSRVEEKGISVGFGEFFESVKALTWMKGREEERK